MAENKPQKGLFARFRDGLTKTRESLSGMVDRIIHNYKKIDDDFYDELLESLILSDVGGEISEQLVAELKKRVREEHTGDTQRAAELLKDIICQTMSGEATVFTPPTVLLVVGVNGVGKTTTIGKLAARLKGEGKRVLICAADTFRAAAIEQLGVWADRAGVPMIRQNEGADPAAVVYDGIQAAKARKTDVLICDTAGRLHNKKHLMEELHKIARIVSREYPQATVQSLLVLDATTGQNGLNQAMAFREAADITGVVLTKLDSTSKGGIAIAISQKLALPVQWVTMGESIEDIQPFDAQAYAEALF